MSEPRSTASTAARTLVPFAVTAVTDRTPSTASAVVTTSPPAATATPQSSATPPPFVETSRATIDCSVGRAAVGTTLQQPLTALGYRRWVGCRGWRRPVPGPGVRQQQDPGQHGRRRTDADADRRQVPVAAAGMARSGSREHRGAAGHAASPTSVHGRHLGRVAPGTVPRGDPSLRRGVLVVVERSAGCPIVVSRPVRFRSTPEGMWACRGHRVRGYRGAALRWRRPGRR